MHVNTNVSRNSRILDFIDNKHDKPHDQNHLYNIQTSNKAHDNANNFANFA